MIDTKEAFRIMKTSLDGEVARISGEMDEVGEHSMGLPQVIEVRLEDPPEYGPDTPKEELYREIGKLDARAVNPFALINEDYIKSALARYDAIYDLVEDTSVREWIDIRRAMIAAAVEAHEETNAEFAELDRKHKARREQGLS